MKKILAAFMIAAMSLGAANASFALPSAPQTQHLRKDGKPDRRYKKRKHLRKNGKPDRRYKENKVKKH